MVHFVLTRSGYEALLAELSKAPSLLWANYGVLSQQEVATLYEQGISISTFTSPISRSNPSEFADALHTISEHHPGESLWVEPEA